MSLVITRSYNQEVYAYYFHSNLYSDLVEKRQELTRLLELPENKEVLVSVHMMTTKEETFSQLKENYDLYFSNMKQVNTLKDLFK